jgi:hypothetical protein
MHRWSRVLMVKLASVDSTNRMGVDLKRMLQVLLATRGTSTNQTARPQDTRVLCSERENSKMLHQKLGQEL